ncbi:hypothetical protein EDD21DRAFT_388651 [Dissophora ornata]|nr:hypothetical protein EDD21DRAFT_388651 [Dissophora ornata]
MLSMSDLATPLPFPNSMHIYKIRRQTIPFSSRIFLLLLVFFCPCSLAPRGVHVKKNVCIIGGWLFFLSFSLFFFS